MKKNIKHNLDQLKHNSYPGRGIIVGREKQGSWILVYWLMGRSQNSRNRVLVLDGGIVRTQAIEGKIVKDSSLIIYPAIRQFKNFQIVSNGSQTEQIVTGLNQGQSFEETLANISYEPDEPNFTPRISALIDTLTGELVLSIISKDQFSTDSLRRFYRFDKIPAGEGVCIHTYLEDGNPLPSFDKDPFEVSLEGKAEEIADFYWNLLNKKNRVALVVKKISPKGEVEYVFRNEHD